MAINERGQIIGSSLTGDLDPLRSPVEHAFLWEDGRMQDLGTLGGFWSVAFAINDHGQVVGTSDLAWPKRAYPISTRFSGRPGRYAISEHLAEKTAQRSHLTNEA